MAGGDQQLEPLLGLETVGRHHDPGSGADHPVAVQRTADLLLTALAAPSAPPAFSQRRTTWATDLSCEAEQVAASVEVSKLRGEFIAPADARVAIGALGPGWLGTRETVGIRVHDSKIQGRHRTLS